jgi:hypothetical protein
MNDPHVVALKYRLIKFDSLEFNNPPDVEVNTPDFQGHLSNDLLTLEPKQHYSSEAEVRPLADALVRSWQIDAGLKYGRPDFLFRFEGSQMLDRQPPPNAQVLQISGHFHMTGDLHLKRAYAAYPNLPQGFRLIPEVEVLWERYCRYIESQEPLLSMAYFCLTLLERGNRKQAAKHYSIQLDVLRKLGELTSTRGDSIIARKLTSNTIPLSSDETVWVEAAIKAIIRHLATANPGQALDMTDLPLLP